MCSSEEGPHLPRGPSQAQAGTRARAVAGTEPIWGQGHAWNQEAWHDHTWNVDMGPGSRGIGHGQRPDTQTQAHKHGTGHTRRPTPVTGQLVVQVVASSHALHSNLQGRSCQGPKREKDWGGIDLGGIPGHEARLKSHPGLGPHGPQPSTAASHRTSPGVSLSSLNPSPHKGPGSMSIKPSARPSSRGAAMQPPSGEALQEGQQQWVWRGRPRIAHIPHSLPWLGALPAASQPGPRAPTAPSRAAPELDEPCPPSRACNGTKRLAWGTPAARLCPPIRW